MIIANVFRYPLKKTVLEVNSQKMIDIINSGSDEYSMETSNAIWIKKDYLLTIKYVSNAGAYYYGAIIPLDFVDEPEARKRAKEYFTTSKKQASSLLTEGTWKKLSPERKGTLSRMISENVINHDTLLVITNTIYFNGTWEHKF